MMQRLPWLFTFLALGCSEEPKLEIPDVEVCLERRDGARYCIDVYEASREDATMDNEGMKDEGKARSLPGRLPWRNVSWGGARAACEANDKRLCAIDEWTDACDGAIGDGGNTYPYGDTLDATRCNTGGTDTEPTGARETCKAVTDTYDQGGNLWEWSGNTMGAAAARGGGWRSTQTHRCRDALPGASPNDSTEEIGFRCCRDS